jgi:hypothetical protein
MPRLLDRFSDLLSRAPRTCGCASSMMPYMTDGQLGHDWRTWFNHGEAGGAAKIARS